MHRNSIVTALIVALFILVFGAQSGGVPSVPHVSSPFISSEIRKVMAGSDGTNAFFLLVDSQGRLVMTPTNELLLGQIYDFSRSADSTNQIISEQVSTTHIEGCDVLYSGSIGADSLAWSAIWTSGLYDQKTLFVEKSAAGSATDSLYVYGSWEASFATAYLFKGYQIFGTTTDTMIVIDEGYTPYNCVLISNTGASQLTWEVRECGKSAHGN